jgi:hypothetical protein
MAARAGETGGMLHASKALIRPGVKCSCSLAKVMDYVTTSGGKNMLIVALQYNVKLEKVDPKQDFDVLFDYRDMTQRVAPVNFASLLGSSRAPFWEDVTAGWNMNMPRVETETVHHVSGWSTRRQELTNVFCVIPNARVSSPTK